MSTRPSSPSFNRCNIPRQSEHISPIVPERKQEQKYLSTKTSQNTGHTPCIFRYTTHMDTNLFTLMQTWGYYLIPHQNASSPGYPGVIVAIRETPTEKHFDPEWIEVQLLNSQDQVEHCRLGPDLHRHFPKRLCPGRLTLHDRYAKRVDFYTFGATIDALSQPAETIYSITSSAPILLLAEDDDNFPEQFEAEAAALLASIHVQWALKDIRFNHRLVEFDPAQLYQATLRSLLARYTEYPALHERFPRFFTHLQHEYQWQASQHPGFAQGPRLESLLQPPPT